MDPVCTARPQASEIDVERHRISHTFRPDVAESLTVEETDVRHVP
jgi:hypothetical protein